MWNHTFDAFLKLYNLITTIAHTCVHYRPPQFLLTSLSAYLSMLAGIVCVSNEHELDDVIQHLACMFRDMPMDYYTGFQVHHDPHTHTILINQAHYVSNIIKQFQLDTANYVSTPTDTHLPLQATQGPDDLALPPLVPYREAVGCLMYAIVFTRPNIAFDIS